MALQFGTRFWAAMKDGPPGSKTGTPFSERYFNPIWRLIDSRLGALEDTKADWEEQSNQLNTLGLARLEQVLGPSFARLGRIAELGFLMAHSTTSETLVEDEIATFEITDADERELFHPSAWVTLTKPDSGTDYAIGMVASYVRETGILDVEIKQIVGSPGPHADWEIIAGSGVTIYFEQRAAEAVAAGATATAKATIATNAATSAAATLAAVNSKITVSTASPSGGSEGDIWLKI
jgi:hypothetical protein